QRGAPPGGRGGRGMRFGGGPRESDAGPKQPEIKVDATEDKKWLEYSDKQRQGSGFIPWTPFKHPTLGDVEIGGFVPGFKQNPPADALPAIAEKQLAFLADLADRLPKVRVVNTIVKSPGAGLYEIEVFVANEGYLPTAMAMTRT